MENENNHVSIKKSLLVITLVTLAALALGYFIGRTNDTNNSQPTNESPTQTSSETEESTSGEDVKALVRYTLPDGWEEANCSDSGAVYIAANGADIDCDESPSAPVKISIDPGNNTGCNQLQNVQNVSKHVCISEYINDMLSLKAQTIYNEQSSFGRKVAVDAYYINTGSGVVLVEYTRDDGDNQYQAGWERLAKSIQKK